MGGQGAVYKATDSKLGRTVVIKVLPEELTKEANLKRFDREARLASSLDHPNICTIYDLDEIDGIHFIAMQYVEGKNVRQLVAGRPLELKTALLIALQVSDALAAAHNRGIIHRDIKSGNVMVTPSGQVKVLDFGLAKLQDETQAATSGIHHTELTEVGVPYGTATYAAPEQARGDRVDKRADIFSTGVLLYEMLTGTWPFRGKSTIDVRHAVLYETAPPISDLRPTPIPAHLQEIIDRTLAKDPKDRFQKMEDLHSELRQVLMESQPADSLGDTQQIIPEAPRHLGSNPVSRAMRWFKGITKTDAPTTSPNVSYSQTKHDAHETPFTTISDQDKKSVAILCFRNLGNDPAASFYEFSLADAVITELARIRSLVVRPSSVISRYQGSNRDPREIGEELKVGSVLTAGFMKAGEKFRVTAQLIDVASGEILWSDRIDTSAADIIMVQDTIAQRIVEGLRLELSPAEKVKISTASTDNAAAYEQYLRGRDLFARFIFRSISPVDCAGAINHFEQAIQLDPNFALAHDGLGACYVNRVFKGFGGVEDYERAEAAFTRALAIDPKIYEARMLMVFVYLWRGQKQKARDEVSSARREAPNEAVVHFVKGFLHRLDGEYARALRSYDRLVKLDPAAHDVAIYSKALVFIFMGKFDDAFRQLDSAEEPDNPIIRTFRALALYYTGKIDDAIDLMRSIVNKHPNMPGVRPFFGIFLSAKGEHADALAQLTDDVKRNGEVDADISYFIASVFALENLKDEAFQWLEKTISLGNANLPCFENDANLTNLRTDERFDALMKPLRPKRIVESQS